MAAEIHVEGDEWLSSAAGYKSMASRARCVQQSGGPKGRSGSDSFFLSWGEV